MKSTARTSLYGPSGPPLLPIASLCTMLMALLPCVVNANNNHHAHLLAGHRRGFHHPLFASTKKKQHPLLFNNNNNNDIIPSLLFGVRGGGNDDDFVEENPEYEPPKDDKIDNSDDGTDDDDDDVADDDGSDTEVSEIEGDESSDEERINDGDDDQDEEKEKDLVSISNSKQSKSKHTSSSTMSKSKSSKSSINKRMYMLWKNNQFNIYILLAIIAFRNDIYQLCIQYNIIPTQTNPITGERKIVVRWTTDVLKLILVAEIVRRCFLPSRRPVVIVATTTAEDDESDGTAAIEKRNQTQTTTDDVDDEDIMPTTMQQPSPAVPLLLLLLMILILPTLLRRNIITSGYTPLLLPIVTSFIFRSMRGGGVVDSNLMQWILPALGDGDLVTRMAYMPPLEQHYAFEQLNERYYRDWGAWRKAFPTNPALQSHHHHYYYLGRKNQTSEIGGGSGSGSGRSSASSGMMALIDAITSRKSSSLSSVQQQYSSGSKSKVSSLSNKYPNVYNNGTAIILDMTKLDTQASSMETIRDQISFLVHLVQSEDDEFFRSKQSAGGEVQQANDNVSPSPPSPELEVIVLLESPGGSVSSYGLAASHLQRLRSTRGIKLTICVDTVAASGGYMMACMASPGHLLCAPFAMVGSIGVIGQSVNVQKALEKFGVRPYVFLGGRNKQPVGMLGDVTKDGMETMQHMIDRIHESFREHVREAREDSLVKAFVAEGGAADKPPSNYFQLGNSQTKLSHSQQSLDRVANGDVFLGVQALKLGLVDRLITSDEYIAERIQHGTRVLKLVIHRRPVGLSSLLIGPPHHSFAWNKWIVRAKNVASMIASSWSDIDASHVNSVQLKMENTRL